MASPLPNDVNTDTPTHSEQTERSNNTPLTSTATTVENETDNPNGNRTITNHANSGIVQNPESDANGIMEPSESHFGDEESNADQELGDPTIDGEYPHSDDDDDESELSNGLLTELGSAAGELYPPEWAPESLAAPDDPREESPYYYSETTEDEEFENRIPQVNGIRTGQGTPEVEDPHPDSDDNGGRLNHDHALAPLGDLLMNRRPTMRHPDENVLARFGQVLPNAGSRVTDAGGLSPNRRDYAEYQPLGSPYARTFTGRPVMHGRSFVPTFRPFSRQGRFHVDPVDWDDDEERIRISTIRTLASRLGPQAIRMDESVEKENEPPGSTSPRSSPEPPPRQRRPSPNRYNPEGTEEYRHHSFGALRPVPSYPAPSSNVNSNAPLTSAHIWYQTIARDIQDVPEDGTLVTGTVRPLHEPRSDGV